MYRPRLLQVLYVTVNLEWEDSASIHGKRNPHFPSMPESISLNRLLVPPFNFYDLTGFEPATASVELNLQCIRVHECVIRSPHRAMSRHQFAVH